MKRYAWMALACAVLAAAAAGPTSRRVPAATARRAAEVQSSAVVVQANGNKDDFERALKLASNMHEILKKARFEIVVFGPAVKFLTAFDPEAPLVQKMQQEGMQVIACGRSLDTEHVRAADLAPNIKVVPYGAVYIVNRQKQGWQYFRP